jgi:CRP-like cAMP-binding protein
VVRAGDCFGEMSLLTGEPRTATLAAREDCQTLEIPKEAMAVVLRENPEILRGLSELLATRQVEMEGALDAAERAGGTKPAERRARYAEGFFQRVKAFFQL